MKSLVSCSRLCRYCFRPFGHAQDPAPQTTPEEAAAPEDVIIVTATRRASPLSDVPYRGLPPSTAASLTEQRCERRRQQSNRPPRCSSPRPAQRRTARAIRGVGTVNLIRASALSRCSSTAFCRPHGRGLVDLGEIRRSIGCCAGRGARCSVTKPRPPTLSTSSAKSPEFKFGAKGRDHLRQL